MAKKSQKTYQTKVEQDGETEEVKKTLPGSPPDDYIPNPGDSRNRIRVQFDIGYTGTPGRDMDPKSETIPDLNLTVRQLLENHTRGQGGDVEVRSPMYFETEIPVFEDMVDAANYREHVQNNLKLIDEQLERMGYDHETGQFTEQPDFKDQENPELVKPSSEGEDSIDQKMEQ